MRYLLIVLSMLLMVACSNKQYAGTTSETTNGTLVGKVEIANGQKAYIILYAYEIDETLTTETDEDGNFSFDNLKVATYTMTVIDSKGESGFVEEVVLDENKEFEVETVKLDSLISVYFVSDKFDLSRVENAYVSDLGMELTKLESISNDTLFLGKVPKNTYNQILLKIDGKYHATLDKAIKLDSVKKHYINGLIDFDTTAYGYYAYQYTDTLDYDTIGVSSYNELKQAVENDSAKVINVVGEIWGDKILQVKSAKKIIGQSNGATLNGFGLSFSNRSEIVVKNIIFKNSVGDALEINNSKHVWVDHCEFENAADELISVIHGSDNVTISWSEFRDVQNALLIGNGDKNGEKDSSLLHVTLYGNLFNQTVEQNPRVRFGTVDMVNNVWRDVSYYGVASTMYANLNLESNVFLNVATPTIIGHTSTHDGNLIANNNELFNSGEIITNGDVDPMPYSLPIKSAAWVKSSVSHIVGVRVSP